jgi:small subunit ribosomal protein S6|uniref:Small ribosomal subunit protein bS6 n=1 Tax=candidate division WOR-3 bacterium TaxID=2052148 RepID=A0A7V3VVB3_UNCW3
MRNYEAMFIFHPELKDDQLEKEVTWVEEFIKNNGADSIRHQFLGKKVLAYPVEKQNEGFYVNYEFKIAPNKIAEIREALKHRGNILRFMILLKEKKR